ncbi:MAG TPA: ABC transporter substrate-binding protein, partial [Micromonosporaceae bacterium]|nr:ABC transporter substrate-binding protein [Micromonosporaceae bacterium]
MRKVALAAPLLAAALLVSATGCGNDAADKPAGKTKITIATFGDFGYQALYKEYMTANPNIEVVERVTKTEDHHKNLVTHLATNTGSSDIEAIEEGWIGQFTSQPAKFNNWMDFGGAEVKSQWPDWKWKAATANNGTVLGLGTDVGGMAMCYRKDLFEKAGLPGDREAVSKLWPTWDDYIATGVKFNAAKLPGTGFFDGPQVIYRSILGQQPIGIYDGEKVVVETNPGVKKAWDQTIKAMQLGLSAKIEA